MEIATLVIKRTKFWESYFLNTYLSLNGLWGRSGDLHLKEYRELRGARKMKNNKRKIWFCARCAQSQLTQKGKRVRKAL